MGTDRRSFMKYSLAAAAAAPGAINARQAAAETPLEPEVKPIEIPGPIDHAHPHKVAKVPYKRIATEEAWTTPEIVKEYTKIIDANPADEQGFVSMWGRSLANATPESLKKNMLVQRLLDMDQRRLGDMDAAGIDMQLLLLTAPGVQVFEKDMAVGLAKDSNDQLFEAVKRQPKRFAGFAAVAPQDPAAGAKEIERAISKLGMYGVVINSHTKGEYLGDKKFWPILEAIEASGKPLYIHPRTPSPDMIKPFLQDHMERAIMGFGVEVAYHVMDMIIKGVFDEFPNLKLMIGHAGEGLPYWLYRIDYMHTHVAWRDWRKLKMHPSAYMQRNLWVTSSGVPWGPALKMSQELLGVDHVIYAMDYPYEFRAEEVTLSDNLDMTPAVKKKFFQTNIEDLTGLKA
jgi:2,3-dihydroxybenzoate decarboxylase